MPRRHALVPLLCSFFFFAVPAWAGEAELSAGDTAWVLTSSALVLLMLPGLALFYAGMVRSKNVLSTIMLSFIAMGVLGVQWVAFGYSFAFGGNGGALFGGFDHLFLAGITGETLTGSIPTLAFVMFQGMFAVITPALISGALVERVKFGTYALFIFLWAVLVYDPLAHWVWGEGGWLFKMGALDFAGGTVVHISSGVSALALILVLGKRRGYPTEKFVGRRFAVVWLVRVQRRQRPGRQRHGCAGLRFNEHSLCRRPAWLAPRREVAVWQAERLGCCFRVRGGPGRDHPRRRVHYARLGTGRWFHRRVPVLLRGLPQGAPGLRRLA